MAGVTYDSEEFQKSVQALQERERSLQQSFANFRKHLLNVAETVGTLELDDQVEPLRETYRRAFDAEKDCAAFEIALSKIRQEYAASDKANDFEKWLGQTQKIAAGPLRAQIPSHPDVKELDALLGVKDEADDDNDDLIVDEGNLTQETCAVSQIKVLDLKDPVEDQKGYVYESAYIRDYIRQHGGTAPSPQAGTLYSITEASLKPSRKVNMWKRRAVFKPVQPTQNDDDDFVMDA